MEKLYMGLTPVPGDFDAFWAERMAEADAVPLDYEISASEIPSFDTVDYLDLRFIGMGGARLYAKYVKPRSTEPVPLVLQFHGYPGATRSWFEQSSFAGMGCALLALDNPGQGGRSQDVGGFAGTTVSGHIIAGLDGPLEGMYYVRLYQDVRVLCRIVRELDGIDLSRVFVNGASQGGGMGIACCALNPDLVAGASILYPFLSDFRQVYELGADEVAYEGIRYYSRWFDPDGTRADEWFGKLAYIDTASFAHLVRCPVLFGTGTADTVCPPKTQDAVYNNLACPKERRYFEGLAHEEIAAFDDMIPAFYGENASMWQKVGLAGDDGAEFRVRHVSPKDRVASATVLLFHDHGIAPRGWHHLTRYAALGYEVLELENRSCDVAFDRGILDARTLFRWAASRGAGRPIMAFGEGFGASLALGLAACEPVSRAASINPLQYGQLMEVAPRISCPVLLATCLMDEVSPAPGQEELAALIPAAQRIHYPKYGHERVNAFENALLTFMHL